MTLDARQRSSLYDKFVQLIGEDDANALMSNFPDTDDKELVTKEFLRAELAEFDARIAQRFEKQTVWMVSTMVAMTAIFSFIVNNS